MDHTVTGDRCYTHETTVEKEMTKKQIFDEYIQSTGAPQQSQGESDEYTRVHTVLTCTYSIHIQTQKSIPWCLCF